jgi:FkbM family methyltransferase
MESASIGLVLENGPLRLKSCRHGLFLYLATDRYIGHSLDVYGEWSEEELRLLANFVRPGDTVLDVGANVGTHTVALARMVGPQGTVVALEPQRALFQILCANAALNRLPNVEAIQAGVGRTSGWMHAPRIDYSRVENFGGVSLFEKPAGERVAIRTIDDLDLPACSLIKIDVEGMELDAIAGAAGTLRRHRPILYVENDRPEKSPPLIEALLALDYRLYWHLPRMFDPRNYFGQSRNDFPGLVSAGMLCVWRETPVVIQGLRAIESAGDYWS